jgi:hypothetical protein
MDNLLYFQLGLLMVKSIIEEMGQFNNKEIWKGRKPSCNNKLINRRNNMKKKNKKK